MARIRTIKPDAFKSYSLSRVSRGMRWTFAGLWTYLDDEGRGRDDVRLIKAELYPLDDAVSLSVLTSDLEQLVSVGCICRYEIAGRAYLHIPEWWHQKINRPTASKYPPCPKTHDMSDSGDLSDGSVSDHGGLTDDSLGERKGTGKGMSEVAAAPTDLDESDDVPPMDPDREDVERVCLHLIKRMVGNGYKRPPITLRWREAARLMLDRDGRTEDEIHRAIDWAHDSEFWRANIKSLPKLRDQYDTLRLQAAAKSKSNVHAVDFGAPQPDPETRVYAKDDVRARFQ